jgi:hypothetical protein
MSDSEEKASPNKEDLSSEDIQEVGQTIEKLSKKEPKLVAEFMALAKMGSMPNPLHDKLSDEHIGKIVDLAVKHDERQYDLHKTNQSNEHKDKQSDKKYYFAYFSVAVIVFLIVLIYLKDTPEILIPTLTGLGG